MFHKNVNKPQKETYTTDITDNDNVKVTILILYKSFKNKIWLTLQINFKEVS